MGYVNRLTQKIILAVKAGALDDKQKLELLGVWLESQDGDRVTVAVRAIGNLRTAEAFEMLEKFLSQASWFSERALVLEIFKSAGHVLAPAKAIASLFGGRGYEFALNHVEFLVSDMFEVIHKHNPDAIPLLLRDSRERVRRAAARALDRNKWQASTSEDKAYYLVAKYKAKKAAELGSIALAALANGIIENTESERKIISRILPSMEPPATDDLAEKFHYSFAMRKWEEIKRMGPGCIPFLMTAIQASQEPATLSEVVAMLGNWRHAEAIRLIVPMLNNSSMELVNAAKNALWQMPQEDVLEHIVSFVRSLKSYKQAAEASRFFENSAAVIHKMGGDGDSYLSFAIMGSEPLAAKFLSLLRTKAAARTVQIGI